MTLEKFLSSFSKSFAGTSPFCATKLVFTYCKLERERRSFLIESQIKVGECFLKLKKPLIELTNFLSSFWDRGKLLIFCRKQDKLAKIFNSWNIFNIFQLFKLLLSNEITNTKYKFLKTENLTSISFWAPKVQKNKNCCWNISETFPSFEKFSNFNRKIPNQ